MSGLMGNLPLQCEIFDHYSSVRRVTEDICSTLEIEDYVLQGMVDVSPPKWHLAHTSWFFEQMVCIPYLREYRPFNSCFFHLFNSYYEALGSPFPRGNRGLLSRPTVKEVYDYRHYVDAHIKEFVEGRVGDLNRQGMENLILGIQHEHQHQELLLTDIKFNFFLNPLKPALRIENPKRQNDGVLSDGWQRFEGGLRTIGYEGDGFCFDNEKPHHRAFIEEFHLAKDCVSNARYLDFIEDGGYRDVRLWLSDGWALVQKHSWQAPLYWEKIGEESEWQSMTLHGMIPLDLDAPVSHVSYFEADAFARWCGARLPFEQEWEFAADAAKIEGNFLENLVWRPLAMSGSGSIGSQNMFGNVWEWTQSAYQPYPGFKPIPGVLGEYNGKFMCSQFVLRGGSCASPRSLLRKSYRNFFPPNARWQFSGIRLAKD